MVSRHVVRRAADEAFAAPAEKWAHGSEGYTRWSMLDETTPAVHTGFGLCRLDPVGSLPAHVHSYEESFFILEGTAQIRTDGQAVTLVPGDYGVIPVAVGHSWHNLSDVPVRWADMLAPQPRSRFDGDSYAVPALAAVDPVEVDARDMRTRRYGHIEPSNMDVGLQNQENLARSASMRTALLVYSGITVKMMVDAEMGAELTTMFMVQYGDVGVIGGHDHPFEETYYFLEGLCEADFDGQRYELRPGDVAFAGVGCVHGFRNIGSGPLRWLETQAPQPPRRHSYRFARDTNYLRDLLEKEE
jgi:mannose-6-phosphate isomerase-like protein (cupin superfamily)